MIKFKSFVKQNPLNLFSLIIIQGSNAILPLLVFPYVLKNIGDENYSQVVITESIMFFIYTFVVYSFEVNGVSKVIKYTEEKDNVALSKLFTKVLLVRLLFFFIFLFLIIISSLFIEKSLFLMLLYWMLFPLSFIFQSSYFYLGIENNFKLSAIIFFSRLLCVILIFFFINTMNDKYLVPIIIGGSYLIGGLLSFILAIFKFNIRLKKISFKDLKDIIIEGKEIFLGNISVLLFRGLNVVFLGVLTSNTVVISSYSISEKIIKSIQASVRPLNQFFFTKGVKYIKNCVKPSKDSFRKLSKVTVIQLIVLILIVSAISVFLFFFKYNVYLLERFSNLNLVINFSSIMIISVFFGVMNFMYGTVGLNHLNSEKYFAFSILLTGIISLVVSIVLITFLNGIGASISFVFAEILLFCLILKKYYFNKT